MNIHLLFRKKTPMTAWGLSWLRGAEEHPYPARRNPGASGVVSAILIRSTLAALAGKIRQVGYGEIQVERNLTGLMAEVESHSTPGTITACWWSVESGFAGLPHGAPDRVTYHLGILGIADALQNPEAAADWWAAYRDLLESYQAHGKSSKLGPALCRACDELYYYLRYRDAPPEEADCRLTRLEVGDNLGILNWTDTLPVEALTDPAILERQLTGLEPTRSNGAAQTNRQNPAPNSLGRGFVGWQAAALDEALTAGENVLLAGPTGTGKTMLTQQVVLESGAELVTVEGKEGLIDLDFFGAILPQPDNSRQWVDGPVLRAMRQAQTDSVVLFLDELNRIPRPHLNLLLGLMNTKSRALCQRQGLAVMGTGPFYVVEVPMTSEVVWCPAAHLRLVAAGNFGRIYQVYDLDPAVRRRFDTVLEFSYLPFEQELALLQRETGLGEGLAEALVRLAHETRRMLDNGELPGCVDTASLLNWARKCARTGAASVSDVIGQAKCTWADLVCGRDHTGRVNPGNLDALSDYLVSLGLVGR